MYYWIFGDLNYGTSFATLFHLQKQLQARKISKAEIQASLRH